MFILSNQKILLIFAMVACRVSFANAEGTRGEAARRLKSSKSDTKSSKASSRPAKVTNFVNGVLNSVTTSTNLNTAVVVNSNTVSSFEEKCPIGVLNAIESCSPHSPFICKTCVVGQSNLNTPTVNGVLKCGNIKIGGRICYGCDDQVILDFYNCGTGGNMTLPGSEPVVAVTTPTNPVTSPGLTTPSVGSTTTIIGTTVGSGTTTTVTATVSSSDGIIPGPPPDASYCPPENVAAGEYIESGQICNTSGYEYLECYYPGKVCSCYAIQPQFMCVGL